MMALVKISEKQAFSEKEIPEWVAFTVLNWLLLSLSSECSVTTDPIRSAKNPRKCMHVIPTEYKAVSSYNPDTGTFYSAQPHGFILYFLPQNCLAIVAGEKICVPKNSGAWRQRIYIPASYTAASQYLRWTHCSFSHGENIEETGFYWTDIPVA